MDNIDQIRDGLSVSRVTKQALEGTRALSSLLEFQPVMLPEVLEMLGEFCSSAFALDPCSSWLMKAREEILTYGDCQRLS